MPGDFKFNPPAWTGEPILIAELWELRKGHRRALCTLWNHADGGAELRLDVQGRGSTAYASRDVEQLLSISGDWHEELIRRARWSAVVPDPPDP